MPTVLQPWLGHWYRRWYQHKKRVSGRYLQHKVLNKKELNAWRFTVLHSQHVYIAPSGVQKERMEPHHLFVMTLADRTLLRQPPVLKPSACTPLFYNAYTMRDAGACIHTHSQNAVMATLLYPGSTFEISHQEMIKGIRRGSTKTNLRYFDKLVVPIVENTPEEEDLTERMAKVFFLFFLSRYRHRDTKDRSVIQCRLWKSTQKLTLYLCDDMAYTFGEVRQVFSFAT